MILEQEDLKKPHDVTLVTDSDVLHGQPLLPRNRPRRLAPTAKEPSFMGSPTAKESSSMGSPYRQGAILYGRTYCQGAVLYGQPLDPGRRSLWAAPTARDACFSGACRIWDPEFAVLEIIYLYLGIISIARLYQQFVIVQGMGERFSKERNISLHR